jgi:hypothetical protein
MMAVNRMKDHGAAGSTDGKDSNLQKEVDQYKLEAENVSQSHSEVCLVLSADR